MKRRIVSIVIAAMTLILCAVPATAEPGSSEALYSDGLVTSESAVYSLIGADRIAVNVPAKMTAAEMKSQLVSSRGVDVIAPDGESVLADDSFVPAGSTLQLTEVGIVTDRAKIYVMGDVNRDGDINTKDIVLFIRKNVGWDVDGFFEEYADVSGDGKSSASDIIVIIRYCSGWDVSFAQPTASDEIEIAGTFTERFCTSKDTQSTVQLRAGELALRFYVAPLSWCDGITVPLKFDAAVGSDASYNLHVYRWNGDYASTVASEPRAEKSGTLDASSSDEQIVTVSTKSADGDAHGFLKNGTYLAVISAGSTSGIVAEITGYKSDDGFAVYSNKEALDAKCGMRAEVTVSYDKAFDVAENINASSLIDPVFCTVKIPGMKGTDTLVQLTDSHFTLMYDDEFGTGATGAKRTQNAIDRTALFTSLGGGINSADRFPYFLEYARQFEAKHILATGDMIDFSSEANIDRMFKEYLSKSGIDFTYCFGNHDWSFLDNYQSSFAYKAYATKKFPEFMGGSIYFEAVDMGDYFIVSLKNDENTYYDSQLEELKKVSDLGKPILLMAHIPFHSPTLVEDTKADWGGRDITLGEESDINYSAATRNMYEYVISDESNVVAIFTGHLHFNHEDLVEGKIPQYVTDAAFEGGCRIITVTGK